jgi:hypothetical protein
VTIDIGWTDPGRIGEADVGDYVPGGVWRRRIQYLAGVPQVLYTYYVDYRVVEWVSTDFAGTSARFCDSSDLTRFAAWFNDPDNIGKPVRWGLSTETPDLSPNFWADVKPDTPHDQYPPPPHYVDAGDIATFGADLGVNHCQASKAGDQEEVVAMMGWFGFNRTGRMIEIAPGRMAPEYTLPDLAQLRLGLSDPEGWRNTISGSAAERVPWTAVKHLYR